MKRQLHGTLLLKNSPTGEQIQKRRPTGEMTRDPITPWCGPKLVSSVRNQSIGCALAWVTTARDPESDYPFYPVGQFRRIRAGHLWCQISSCLTKLSLSVSSDSYCTSIIVGPRVMVTHLLPYILTIALCGQWNIQCSEPVFWLCSSVGYYSTWLWIRLSILSCGAIPQDSCKTLMVSDQLKFNKIELKC